MATVLERHEQLVVDGAGGALAGAAAGAVMVIIREPLVATGALRWTPPRAITRQLVGDGNHPLLRTSLHLAYAAALGVAYAALERRSDRVDARIAHAPVLTGAAWGAAVWFTNLV